MKKTILLLLISTFATALLFSVTALMSKTYSERAIDSTISTSSAYTILHFEPPIKNVYTLDEINCYIPNEGSDCPNHTLKQEIEFDGEGMFMIVKDANNNVRTYEYSCEYFEIDGQILKFEEYFKFDFDIEENLNEYGLLEERIYTANVILVTDNGDCITHDFDFFIEDAPATPTDTQSAPQPSTEKITETQEPTEKPTEKLTEKPTEKPTEKSNLVIPTLKKHWNKANETGQHIEILSQNGNKLTMIITNANDASDIVSTEFTVTLNNVYESDGLIKGNGTFHYTDSLGIKGVGVIIVSKNTIILDMSSQYPAGQNTGWCVNTSTGKYI